MYLEMGNLMLFILMLWETKLPWFVDYYFAVQICRNLGFQLTLFQPEGGRQILPTTLLLAHPYFKT